MSEEEIYNHIQSELLKTTLEQRVGYNLANSMRNHKYEHLPEYDRQRFTKLLETMKQENKTILIIAPCTE